MANRYWVGGTATWDATAGTKWATTSGGAGGAAVPTASDDVYFDSNSGSGTVTVSGTRTCLNFDSTGFTGTITGTATPILTVSGTLVIIGDSLTFNSISGPLIQNGAATTIALFTNGKQIAGLTLAVAGCGITLEDVLDLYGLLTLTTGTFDANNFAVSIGGMLSSGTATRALSMGSGAWLITGAVSSNLWSISSATGLTLNFGTAPIRFDSIPFSACLITFSTKFPNPVTIGPIASALNRVTLNGALGFADLTVEGPNLVILQTNTVIDDGIFIGSYADRITLITGSGATRRDITVSGAVTGSWVTACGIGKVGAGTITFEPGFDARNNSGVVFNQPLLPAAQYGMGI